MYLTSCTAQCGLMVSDNRFGPEEIVSCFKNRCKYELPSPNFIDKELYNKYQT